MDAPAQTTEQQDRVVLDIARILEPVARRMDAMGEDNIRCRDCGHIASEASS